MAAKSTEAPETGAKKGGMLKLVILLVVVLALLGGGGFAAWKFLLQPKAEEAGHDAPKESAEAPAGHGEKAPEATEQASEGGASEEKGSAAAPEIVKFDPFVVNLADPMGRRYLKVTMEVEVAPGSTEALNAALPRAKDTLLLLLSSKFYSELSSMDQKIELKNEIMERLNQIIGKGKVKNIYFTEFVIQ